MAIDAVDEGLDPEIGADRTLLLTGIPVCAREMLDAVHKSAGARKLGKVSFNPDPSAQEIMDSVARSTFSARRRTKKGRLRPLSAIS